ncbi:MAG: DUF1631 domain-containing protein, partial [Burkholderiaceae bacterium]|nr:DUF1631 domain-containing protein [Burkholderiaceae bacterium]
MSVKPSDSQAARVQTQSSVPGDVWHVLVQQVTHLSVAQIDAFAARLGNAFFAASEQIGDAREANLTFNSGQLLKNNAYAFYYLASSALEKGFRAEVEALRAPSKPEVVQQDIALSLVSYEEMDQKLALGRASRVFELASAEELAALNMRLAHLLGQDSLNIAQNPFRPEVFLRILYSVWREYCTDVDAHHLILPMLRTDILFDLQAILRSLNETLVLRGVLPDLQESYRIRKTTSSATSAQTNAETSANEEINRNRVSEKLRQFLSNEASSSVAHGIAGGQAIHGTGFENAGAMGGSGGVAADTYNPAMSPLFQYLADLQKGMAIRQFIAGSQDVMKLSQLREQMPDMASSGVERNTLDLLSKVFDSVFRSKDIPPPIKELIGLLQVPVLKAALMDKEFFFQETHPARRLIDLLSKYSASWDQQKGTEDPLFQTMQRNVGRVQREFDQQVNLFDEVVSDLESFMAREEAARAEALQAPITRALQREKFKQANIAAANDVALRVGSGEVVAFVETFLENRWTKVLTLAYSVKDEKPHAVADAIKTMDDLIWSVKPKITLEQRQQMVNRLPAILARLNKWLSLIKWQDADRMQFFADLAECHASIVRAPLDLSPERQLEIAVEVAQKAAERRLEKRAAEEANKVPEVEPDDYVKMVAELERGVWLQFTKKDGST